MIWPRWAAACSSFSINNCVHKKRQHGYTGGGQMRGRQQRQQQQQQRWQRQRSVQAENQLRDSLICMSTPAGTGRHSPSVTRPSATSRPGPVRHLTPNLASSTTLASKSQSPCGYVCDSVETDKHSGQTCKNLQEKIEEIWEINSLYYLNQDN